jgi:hypothetical protein
MSGPNRKSGSACGIYCSLKGVVRLQIWATGFSFLPGQPTHSLLPGETCIPNERAGAHS